MNFRRRFRDHRFPDRIFHSLQAFAGAVIGAFLLEYFLGLQDLYLRFWLAPVIGLAVFFYLANRHRREFFTRESAEAFQARLPGDHAPAFEQDGDLTELREGHGLRLFMNRESIRDRRLEAAREGASGEDEEYDGDEYEDTYDDTDFQYRDGRY